MQFNKNRGLYLFLWLFFTIFFFPYLQAQQGVKQENQGIVVHFEPPVNSVELLDLVGFYSKTMQQVTLSWETGDEKDCQNFLFERRKASGEEWDILGFVPTRGKGSFYDFIDRTPLPLNYYRVRSVDKSGKASFLKIISVSKDDVSHLKVYPKIVKDSLLHLRGIEIADTTARNNFVVFNILGQRVMEGKTKAHIDVSILSRGIYLIKIGVQSIKFLRS